jgi:DNA-binding MarR family transcriptional regulator
MRLARVFKKVDAASARRFRARGLSVAQFDVLAQVGSAEGITQQELADRLLVTKGNVAQVLNGMEGRRWISRRQEGRSNHLYLTDEGRALFDDVVPTQEQSIAQSFSALSLSEQRTLLGLLRKLDRGI